MSNGNPKYTHTKKKWYCLNYKAERGCAVCGEKDPVVLDFHHRDGETKHKNLLNYSSSHKSFSDLAWETMIDEIKKCDVVCSNCHRRITYNEKKIIAEKRIKEKLEDEIDLFSFIGDD